MRAMLSAPNARLTKMEAAQLVWLMRDWVMAPARANSITLWMKGHAMLVTSIAQAVQVLVTLSV